MSTFSTVDELLEHIELSEYSTAFKNSGWDSVKKLQSLTPRKLDTLVKDRNCPRGDVSCSER